jgi:DNA-binding transcriptional LysR family regulator
MGLSQSALSNCLGNLRTLFDDALFVRDLRRRSHAAPSSWRR